ncbi:MAG: CBS domain-containing protein [Deltaproteobacteria bacterium]|nr:CBS domain-containing protein [Deltaproteobacteria bacterium]
MDLVTTHTNADFDTLASMIAARRLYPGAILSFPGTLERGLKEAITALKLENAFTPAESVDDRKVTRLVLVDISRSSRIGRFKELLGKEKVEVHVYDHHPKRDSDIKATKEVFKDYGSTTTILALMLKEKNIAISENEATAMMAGIYEDTGGLTFISVRPEDFEAAAWLLKSGADIKTASSIIKRELTPKEASALSELIKNSARYSYGSTGVILASVSSDSGDIDAALLAHRLMDIEKPGALIVLAETPGRVHAVIRSSTPGFDASKAAKMLGGGGHPEAAFASIKDKTITEAREMATAAIEKCAAENTRARDIMSAPAITVEAGESIEKASALMTRYNVNALPVVEKGRLTGVITRQIADKSAHHGLKNAPVSEFMTIDAVFVNAGAHASEIRERSLGRDQRILPVIDNGKVAGVITRTDLIKLLHKEGYGNDTAARERNAASLVKESLPDWATRLLSTAGEVAAKEGFYAYAVGGFVRDLILRRKNLDIDLVVEGDGIKFSNALAKELGGAKVTTHERFKTAVIELESGFKLDIATARLEYYEKPGALPTVEHSSLKLDLYRRDFTINTLALALSPGEFGSLIDFFGAETDLRDGVIRVMHNLSFIEDPTRAMRAIRFSERFGFQIAANTLRLLKNSVRQGVLTKTSGSRVMDEIINALEEDRSLEIIRRFSELGILRLIHTSMDWNERMEKLFQRSIEAATWHKLLYRGEKTEPWLTLFLALTDTIKQEALVKLAQRLSLGGRQRIEILKKRNAALKALKAVEAAKKTGLKASRVYKILKPLKTELVLYIMARTEDEAVRRAISGHITAMDSARPRLGGQELKKLGVKEGPAMGRLLTELLYKNLDGELKNTEDEVEFARRFIEG